jgi:LAO/AO transport system kinase
MSHFNPTIDRFLTGRHFELKPLDHYIEGITEARDDLILSEAITLLESRVSEHRQLAEVILRACYDSRGNSKRIGVTGPPGVGKSTFIENIGSKVVQDGHSLAVLTIDPSSARHGGSILGDKTRMNILAEHPDVFVRPSPSGGHLGGLHERTYEAMLLCEAAGKEFIIVETVGVGQSEFDIEHIADCVILLIQPYSGDQLQWIKRGITEIADIVIVHKADGERYDEAQRLKAELEKSMGAIQDDSWNLPILASSSIETGNKEEVMNVIEAYFEYLEKNALIAPKRLANAVHWLKNQIVNKFIPRLQTELLNLPEIKHSLKEIEAGKRSPFQVLPELVSQIELTVKSK